MSLIALTDVKTVLEIPSTVTEHDILITSMISDVIADAEGEIELKLEAVIAAIAYLNGDENWLYISHANVSNVSVWEDLDREFSTEDLVDPDNYTIDQARGIIKLHRRPQFYERAGVGAHRLYNVIKVQYDGGYSASDFPRDLKGDLIKQIAYTFRRRKDLGLMSVTFPDGSISKMSVGKWLDDVQKTIDRYHRYTL